MDKLPGSLIEDKILLAKLKLFESLRIENPFYYLHQEQYSEILEEINKWEQKLKLYNL